jgi:hypothetical protein
MNIQTQDNSVKNNPNKGGIKMLLNTVMGKAIAFVSAIGLAGGGVYIANGNIEDQTTAKATMSLHITPDQARKEHIPPSLIVGEAPVVSDATVALNEVRKIVEDSGFYKTYDEGHLLLLAPLAKGSFFQNVGHVEDEIQSMKDSARLSLALNAGPISLGENSGNFTQKVLNKCDDFSIPDKRKSCYMVAYGVMLEDLAFAAGRSVLLTAFE